MTVSAAGDSSDDELDWEEVHVPEQQFDIPLELELASPTPRQNIEITLQARPKKDDAKKKAAAALHSQRVLRTTSHKIHTVALLANAWIRNKWLNNPLLHARLLSITPLSLQNGFAMIHKSRVPDQNKRGHLFEAAIDRLVTWWCEAFFSVTATGHIRSRTFEEVEDEIALASKSDGLDPDDHGYERIRSVESLMKHVLMQRGSRDTSAQLFTALCRSLDIPARLVVSLQSVPWKSKVGKSHPRREGSKGKGKAPQRSADDREEDLETGDQSEMEDVSVSTSKYKGKGKEVTNPVIKVRKQKSQSPSRSGSPAIWPRSLKSPDPTTTPPVFWTEVFSRADSRWLPVDPIRGIVNKRHAFDPNTRASKTSTRQENRMLYVIGLEEDGFGRDVTARYAREYTAKVSKVQGVGGGTAGGRKEWWAKVVQSITRPYRLRRDDLEDAELHTHQLTEGMPTTIAGFKNHPLYALARHLRRDQVIDPPTELGKFRGEPVYPRSSVISLKTAENWMRQGRIIRQGCQPMKMAKQRAVTVSRRREMELALERAKAEGHADGDETPMQGLYALSQTEVYMPEPIKDGKIPKNDFGNIDLYVPSMLPQGAAHIPFKGAAKVAKRLGFDYAEAVTGFEFRKRSAMPVIQGIVVAAENENVMVEACLEAEQDAEERARLKRVERACKRWIRLVHGLRIRERLQKQYGSGEADEDGTPLETQQQLLQRRESWLDTDEKEQLGGYLTTADDVVEPFHLPRDVHRYDTTTVAMMSTARLGGDDIQPQPQPHPQLGEDVDAVATPVSGGGFLVSDGNDDADVEMEPGVVDLEPQPRKGVPKTMRELAASYALRQGQGEAEATPPSKGEKEADLAMTGPRYRREPALQQGTSRRGVGGEGGGEELGPGRRTAQRRPGITRDTRTRTTRTSKKRTRSRTESEGASDIGEETHGTPPKRYQLEACVTPDDVSPAPVSTHASTSNPDPNAPSGRVLRPRRQKSAAQVREEREMERAYRRAVAD